jgi:hypothetical protein
MLLVSEFGFRPSISMLLVPLGMFLEHLQPFEAPGPKSGDIFVRIEYKMSVGGIFFPVVTLAFADIVSK